MGKCALKENLDSTSFVRLGSFTNYVDKTRSVYIYVGARWYWKCQQCADFPLYIPVK